MSEENRKKVLESTIRRLFSLHKRLHVGREGYALVNPPHEEVQEVLEAAFKSVEMKTGAQLREVVVVKKGFPAQDELGEVVRLAHDKGTVPEQAYEVYQRENAYPLPEEVYCCVGSSMVGDLNEPIIGNHTPYEFRMVKGTFAGVWLILNSLKEDIENGVEPVLKIVGVTTVENWEESLAEERKPSFSRSTMYRVMRSEGQPHSMFGAELAGKSDIPTVVASFFSGNWEALSSLVTSLFVSYYVEVGNFERFCVCDNCKGLYLPERLAPDRRYCSSACRKYLFSSKPIEKCYRRQVHWVKYHAGKLGELRGGGAKQKEWAGEYIKPEYLDKSLICNDCLHINKPAGGKCRHFFTANAELVERFKYCKSKKAWYVREAVPPQLFRRR